MKWSYNVPGFSAKPLIDFKIIFIGEAGVGKTSIVNQFIQKNFSPTVESTIGASFSCTRKEHKDRIIKFHIWDTAGQERFRSILNIYYRGADACILVCDLTDEESINSLQYWIDDFYKRTDNPNAQFILVGNKIDLKQQLEKKENVEISPKLVKLAKENNFPLIITSAFTGKNVDEIFDITYTNLEHIDPFAESNLEIVDLSKTNNWFKNLIRKQNWCSIL